MLSLHDTRWLEGFEPFNIKSSGNADLNVHTCSPSKRDGEEFEEFDPFASVNQTESDAKCSSCKVALDNSGRETLIAHYRSDWHRHNARRVAQGRRVLTEEEYEETAEENAQSSVSSDEEDLSVGGLGSSRLFFVQRGTVYSLYSGILLPGEEDLKPFVFKRSLDCAIFLLAGGHFAAGIFRGDSLVVHKTIHRYVVRAKQGGAQSANDNSKGVANSAGAALRRYNERMMRKEIGDILNTWKTELEGTSLIFLRCASYQRSAFLGDDTIQNKDPRIRSIPFATQRPTIDEVRNTWQRLAQVHDHGSKDEFVKNLMKKRELAAKKKTAIQRKKKEISDLSILDDDSDEDTSRPKTEEKTKKTDHIKQEVPAAKEEDPFPQIDLDDRKKLYEWIRKEDINSLNQYLQGVAHQKEVIRYLSDRRFSPDCSTFLHMTARMGLAESLSCLLSLGCDPCKKNDEHKVPYAVSLNKATKAVFISYRKEQPKAWDWLKCHVPEPVELTEEQIAAAAEKKKERKNRQKEKEKEKKEVVRKQKKEETARQDFLALPEREKRARAAEARLAALEKKPSTISSDDRCCQCAAPLPAVPFTYLDVRLCSPACVAAHRTANV